MVPATNSSTQIKATGEKGLVRGRSSSIGAVPSSKVIGALHRLPALAREAPTAVEAASSADRKGHVASGTKDFVRGLGTLCLHGREMVSNSRISAPWHSAPKSARFAVALGRNTVYRSRLADPAQESCHRATPRSSIAGLPALPLLRGGGPRRPRPRARRARPGERRGGGRGRCLSQRAGVPPGVQPRRSTAWREATRRAETANPRSLVFSELKRVDAGYFRDRAAADHQFALYQAARSRLWRGDPARALEALQQLRALDPDHPGLRDLMPRVLIAEGGRLQVVGRGEEAEALFREATGERPSEAGLAVELAEKLVEMGRTDTAITVLSDALLRNPNDERLISLIDRPSRFATRIPADGVDSTRGPASRAEPILGALPPCCTSRRWAAAKGAIPAGRVVDTGGAGVGESPPRNGRVRGDEPRSRLATGG